MQPKPDVPDAPEVLKLNPVAHEEWNRIAPELAAMGVLTRLDAAALEAYCTAWARFLEAEHLINQHGMLLLESKRVRKNPAVGIWAESLQQMRMWCVEFGMTPAARSRIRIDKPAEEDQLDEFLRRGTTPADRIN